MEIAVVTSRPWTCRRCKKRHPSRVKRKCDCGASRPTVRKPAHLKALDLPREVFVEANGGSENCGVCGCPPSARRRHDRDHSHETGKPRGILCPTCNGFLTVYVGRSRKKLTPAYLRSAAEYLERAA